MKFYCSDALCPFEGGGNYTVEMLEEACMDDHNIASPFCPYCNNPMLPDAEALVMDTETE